VHIFNSDFFSNLNGTQSEDECISKAFGDHLSKDINRNVIDIFQKDILVIPMFNLSHFMVTFVFQPRNLLKNKA
jgi:hypothetical protein